MAITGMPRHLAGARRSLPGRPVLDSELIGSEAPASERALLDAIADADVDAILGRATRAPREVAARQPGFGTASILRYARGTTLPVLWARPGAAGIGVPKASPAPRAPLTAMQHALAFAMLLSFAVAYLWQYRLDGIYGSSFWSTYVFGPSLWAIAAALAWAAWTEMPRGEHESIGILPFAVVVGVFGVAVTVLVGIVAGMGHSPYAHAPRWLLTNLWFVGAPLAAFEFTRAYLIRRFAPSSPTLAIAGTAILFTALGVSYQELFGWSGTQSESVFFGGRLLPDLASNILTSFLVYLGGPFAGLAYRGVSVAYHWYSPVLADPPWLTKAFVGVATPAIGMWVLEGLSGSSVGEPNRAEAPRKGLRIGAPSTAWVVTSVLSLGMLWFSFGFFGVRPSFIPSHSMEPGISAGSIVITKDVNPQDVKVGDVVLYDLNGTNVLHRVIEIAPGGMFATKGDNNNTPDPAPVAPGQIRGRLVYDVPYLGWVPIWATRGIQALARR